jgi:hypothetical protein
MDFVDAMKQECAQSMGIVDVMEQECAQSLTSCHVMPPDYNNLQALQTKCPRITIICDHYKQKVPRLCTISDKLSYNAPGIQKSASIANILCRRN